MPTTAEMHARHAVMLARYAELALTLAEQLHADAMAAETPEQRAVLAGAFHRICRSGRQSMALEARLVRDAAREARLEAGPVQAAREARIELRKQRLAQAVEPLIWTEVEDEDQVEALQDLEIRLAEEALSEDFLDEPVETQLVRLCDALGLAHPRPRVRPEVGPRINSGGDPSRVPTSDPAADPSAAWVPAFAGTSGEDFDAAPPNSS